MRVTAKTSTYLGPFAQGHPLRVRLVCAYDVAEAALGKEIINRFRAEADGPTPPQALAEPCVLQCQLLTCA